MIKTGFSKMNITEAFAYKECGYRVADPLYARCFAATKTGKPVFLLVALDFVEIPLLFVTLLRKLLGRTFRISPESIVIHTTHTHSVPNLRNIRIKRFQRLIISALRSALKNAEAAETTFIKTEAGRGFNVNRRWDSKSPMGTFSIIDNSLCMIKRDEIFVKGCVERELSLLGFKEKKISASAKLDGPVDAELNMLLFKGTSGKILGGIVRYASHPTFVAHFGGNIISADYPGELCSALERKFGGNFVFINGCSGDLRPFSKYYNLKSAYIFGRELAGKLIKATKEGSAFSPLTKASFISDNTFVSTRTDLAKDVKQLTANFWLMRERNTPENLSKLPIKTARERDELRWANDAMVYQSFVSNCGNADFLKERAWPYYLGLLSLSGVNYLFFQEEVFSEMTQRLKKNLRKTGLNTVSLSNGTNYYLLPEKELKKGGYESTYSFLGRSAFETVYRAAKKLLVKHSSS